MLAKSGARMSNGFTWPFKGAQPAFASSSWAINQCLTRDLAPEKVMLILMALFGAVFMVCAGLLQVWSGKLPNQGGASLDQFNSSLLWGTSIMALLIAAARPYPAWKLLFWLGLTAGFAMLAIDEVFEFHEYTAASFGDDDHIKIIAWFCAGVGALLIRRIGQTSRAATSALAIALAFQTFWLLSDLGDGDFFTIPIPTIALWWLEEYFELLAAQFYLAALIIHYRNTLLAERR